MVKHKCPCCGYYTLFSEPGSYETCNVCFWEDDPAQAVNPDLYPGSNGVSLKEARKNFKIYGAITEYCKKFVRPPKPEDEFPS